MVVPEKQGLKLMFRQMIIHAFSGISGGSRKTRIETSTLLFLNPGQAGISGGSRKTRIETPSSQVGIQSWP